MKREAQEESRHLWQFAREVGLESDPAGKVYIGDLYKVLEEWYLENGWLTVDDSGKTSKKSWEGESVYDKPVKKSQDLYSRLKELFPKIERQLDTQEHKNRKFIVGLKLKFHANHTNFLAETEFHANRHANRGEDEVSMKSLSNKDSEHGEHEISTFARICNSLNLLTQDELQKLGKLTEAVAKVKVAKTWADVQQAIGDNAELREQVKTVLTKEENVRVAKLKMTADKTI